MGNHTCHADGCEEVVPPRMFMCNRHWRMVPRTMQNEIWAAYVPGQEIRKDPTMEYLQAAMRAIAYVTKREKEKVSN